MSWQLIKIGLIVGLTATIFALEPPFETRSVGDVELYDHLSGYRLPNDTIPEKYNISLITRVDRAQFDFLGNVKIDIFVVNATRQVTVHTRQLTIISVRLSNDSGRELDLLPWYSNVENEFLTIQTQNIDLVKGQRYILEIQYTGTLRTDYGGFYRSSYLNDRGTRSWIATTQFESTNARHAFPCYDEPALKANFTIHITHAESYHAISNMPGRRAQNVDGTVTSHFDTTPPTSTYLIAFIISDFKYVGNVPNSTIRHRVFANPRDYETGQYAVVEGEKVLNAIANYLRVPFTLPKMDQVAIPDFKAGAMENWGLVTYREQYLLYNQSIHLFTRKTDITSIISHEFGHQWFGNLVSPKWWDYIWLNEGFATLFDYIGTDLVHPEWDFLQYFVIRKFQTALKSDAKNITRPMTYYVESPEAVANLFDDIAYSKSGSVLRMFLHAFTEESFKKGLHYYLNARRFDAADEDDLFAALERAVKEEKTLAVNYTVKEIFSSWSQQKGVPVLHVKRNANGTVTISQERYFTENPKEPDLTTWWIPYNVASKQSPSINQTVPSGWLAHNQRTKVVEPTATIKWLPNEWVLFNQQSTGYYRVQYEAENYELLTNELKSGDLKKIHPISRAQLIFDLFDFIMARRLPDSLFLDLIGYLKGETEYAPWASAKNAINLLSKQLDGTPQYTNFRALIASVVAPIYKTIGLADSEQEAHFRKYTRVIVTDLACEFGVESCLNDTYVALMQCLTTGRFDSQNNRRIIYANGIRKANATELNAVWERFIQSKNSEERTEILWSLGHISNETVLSQFLDRSIVDYVEIRFTNAERSALVNSIAQSSQRGLALVLRLLTTQTDESIKWFAGYQQLLLNLADRIVTTELQTQYVSLLKTIRQTHSDKLDEKTMNKATAIVDGNLKWLSVHLKPIEAYFLHKPNVASQAIVSSFPLIIAIIFATSYIQY